MEKLTEQELLHVANLARLELNEQEKEKFSVDLAAILNDIEKIKSVDIKDSTEEIMISPSTNVNEYHDVDTLDHIGKEEALKNSKLSDGDYIVVPQVIND